MLMAIVAMFAFTACGDDENPGTNNGNKITSDQLIGTWYGVDENSSKKINLFVMDFTTNGKGHYAEYKAKAEENWVSRDPQSADMTWTLTNGTLVADVNGTPRKGDILSLNGNKITVRRYLEEGRTDEIVMTRVNSANEVMQIFQQMIAEKKGGQQGDDINPSDVIGSWTAVAFTPEGQSRIVLDRSKEEHWPYCQRYEITANEITQYAINYRGSEGYRGREEKTLIGKYRIEGNTFIIYDYYEGYHNVKDHEENGGGTMSTEPIQATINLSNSVFYIIINGYGTYELQKGGNVIDDDSNYIEKDATLVGKWGVTRITGAAYDFNSGTLVENWDNHPSKDDVNTGKESLKYVEFTFNDDKTFIRQAFSEEKREFTEIMQGTWEANFSKYEGKATIGEMQIPFVIQTLTEQKFVMKIEMVEEDFRPHGSDKTLKVNYKETLEFVRLQ